MKKILIFAILALFVVACQTQETQLEPAPTDNQEVQDADEFPTEGESKVTWEKTPPGPMRSGDAYEFSWRADGGQSILQTHLEASFSPDFSDHVESRMQDNGPGIYKGAIKMETETERTAYIRAYAMIDGEEIISDVMEMQVIPSDEEVSAPSIGVGEDVQEVTLTAHQFSWDPDPMVVSVDIPVRVTATSTDVDHGIAIPEFGVSEQLPAGETVVFEFTPDRTGEFTFFCNVYCGSGHSGMRGTLIVE